MLPPEAGPGRVLVIACGALVRELLDIVERNDLTNLVIECLPGSLHNTPSLIPAAIEERVDRARGHFDDIYVGYADCGTGGMLDRVLERHGIERLPGAHCYEFFAGSEVFGSIHDDDPRTFYLTDFLTRHFERLVWQGLGLDRYPQLRDDYFRHYRRLVYLSQRSNPDLLTMAQQAANRLGLNFEHRPVGYGDVTPAMLSLALRPAAVATS